MPRELHVEELTLIRELKKEIDPGVRSWSLNILDAIRRCGNNNGCRSAL